MSLLSGNERAIVVTALKHAAPYIRMFKRKVFVLKAGGEAFVSPETTRAIVEQVGILHEVGIRVVLVHGGGPQSTRLAESRGIPIRFVDGRRVTDKDALEVMATVLNDQINPMILAAFRDLDIPAVGICGQDARVIKAHRRPPVARGGDDGDTVDYGYVGDIDAIDADTLFDHLNRGLVILATTTSGILESRDDPRSVISYIDIAGLAKLRDEGRIAKGMLPKAAAIEQALTGGVPRVHVISSELTDSLLLEVFTNEGTGTLEVNDIEHLTPAEQTS
jgi:acetylglutamate kinase